VCWLCLYVLGVRVCVSKGGWGGGRLGTAQQQHDLGETFLASAWCLDSQLTFLSTFSMTQVQLKRMMVAHAVVSGAKPR